MAAASVSKAMEGLAVSKTKELKGVCDYIAPILSPVDRIH